MLVLAFAWPGTAQAYLDPSSGSLIIQALIAAAAAVAYGVRLYWSKLKSLFGGRSKEPPREV